MRRRLLLDVNVGHIVAPLVARDSSGSGSSRLSLPLLPLLLLVVVRQRAVRVIKPSSTLLVTGAEVNAPLAVGSACLKLAQGLGRLCRGRKIFGLRAGKLKTREPLSLGVGRREGASARACICA
jgi:hypothetical protein